MGISELRARWARRDERGFSTITGMAAIGGSVTLAGLLLMTGAEQVSAADSVSCQYDKRVVQTALESYKATSDDLDFPAPAGEDGLDAVRSGGWLRTESTYWQYTGVDATNAPQLVLRREVTGCE